MTSACLLTRTGCWLTLGWLAFSVQAQPVPAADAAPSPQELQQRAQQRAQERQDILHTRAQIDARRVEGEKACWQRFAVDNCLREVRAQAREQDTALRERELRINSEERQEKASERLRAIEQKQREKHAPAPMTSSTKQGAQPAVKTPAELAREQQERQTAAQQRAAAQVQREAAHTAGVAEREAKSEAERAQRVQALQDKQKAAEARRARGAEPRRGEPLPTPKGLPQP
ncbi:hypothetical protein [Comamonas aquatica]|uniref:hypothetical protein n=1 Tax=Comamonas aquatica TaxID=225991 RepID=UPI0024476AB8|nr:hypothetical protein [Comamonas aquatica]MDH0381842.1 hypothetical protein [Comamonas aquatica]MDH0429987.1 hypothetical protein [Comamonas aquatica]MDH0940721.1 hypothetical protein [Comamonas aquatica]